MTTTATERPRETKATHFQPHIQGLRAIAVILVVLYLSGPGGSRAAISASTSSS